MGIGELGRYCVGKANGSIPSVCNGFGVRKACRCARSNGRLAGLESRRQLAREPSEPIRSGVGTSFTIRPRGGSSLRILTLIDEYTKQCLAIEVGRSIRALDAIRVLDGAIKCYAQPEHIRSDNGPEFIAEAIRQWMSTAQIKSLYIQPGSPWEQAYIESFHDKFRDECLNRELFATLAEARVIIESWRREYNQMRPHSALGYLTPDEFGQLNRRATTSCDNQNGRLKTEDTRWASIRPGPNARLIHNRLFPDRRAAATSRTRTGHSRSTPVRGDYG